jgi:hypothetical protein
LDWIKEANEELYDNDWNFFLHGWLM